MKNSDELFLVGKLRLQCLACIMAANYSLPSSVCLSVTSNSSLSFKAAELKFCMQTAFNLAKNVIEGFLKACLGTEI